MPVGKKTVLDMCSGSCAASLAAACCGFHSCSLDIDKNQLDEGYKHLNSLRNSKLVEEMKITPVYPGPGTFKANRKNTKKSTSVIEVTAPANEVLSSQKNPVPEVQNQSHELNFNPPTEGLDLQTLLQVIPEIDEVPETDSIVTPLRSKVKGTNRTAKAPRTQRQIKGRAANTPSQSQSKAANTSEPQVTAPQTQDKATNPTVQTTQPQLPFKATQIPATASERPAQKICQYCNVKDSKKECFASGTKYFCLEIPCIVSHYKEIVHGTTPYVI